MSVKNQMSFYRWQVTNIWIGQIPVQCTYHASSLCHTLQKSAWWICNGSCSCWCEHKKHYIKYVVLRGHGMEIGPRFNALGSLRMILQEKSQFKACRGSSGLVSDLQLGLVSCDFWIRSWPTFTLFILARPNYHTVDVILTFTFRNLSFTTYNSPAKPPTNSPTLLSVSLMSYFLTHMTLVMSTCTIASLLLMKMI